MQRLAVGVPAAHVAELQAQFGVAEDQIDQSLALWLTFPSDAVVLQLAPMLMKCFLRTVVFQEKIVQDFLNQQLLQMGASIEVLPGGIQGRGKT